MTTPTDNALDEALELFEGSGGDYELTKQRLIEWSDKRCEQAYLRGVQEPITVKITKAKKGEPIKYPFLDDLSGGQV